MQDRKSTNWGFGLVLGAAVVLAACGAASTPTNTAPEGGEQDAAAPVEAPAGEAQPVEESASGMKKFEDMSSPEKMEHMKKVIVPEMAKVFKEFDAEEFGKFGCSTCHGPGAKDGNFEMPNKSLPKLDKEEMDHHPEMTKFMMEKVTPKMAELLGEEPFNPETHEGFGCMECHTKKE